MRAITPLRNVPILWCVHSAPNHPSAKCVSYYYNQTGSPLFRSDSVELVDDHHVAPPAQPPNTAWNVHFEDDYRLLDTAPPIYTTETPPPLVELPGGRPPLRDTPVREAGLSPVSFDPSAIRSPSAKMSSSDNREEVAGHENEEMGGFRGEDFLAELEAWMDNGGVEVVDSM